MQKKVRRLFLLFSMLAVALLSQPSMKTFCSSIEEPGVYDEPYVPTLLSDIYPTLETTEGGKFQVDTASSTIASFNTNNVEYDGNVFIPRHVRFRKIETDILGTDRVYYKYDYPKKVGRGAFREIGMTSLVMGSMEWVDIPEPEFPVGMQEVWDYWNSANAPNQSQEPSLIWDIGEYAFADNDLTFVALPSSITNISNYAFKNNKLTSVIFEGGKNVSFGIGAFENNLLTSITLPSNPIVYGDFYQDAYLNIGQRAFANNKITNIDFGSSYWDINKEAFAQNCLTSLILGHKISKVDEGAFKNNLLTELTIQSNRTQIGSYAFTNNKLTSINLPIGVNISDYAFKYNLLETINIPQNVVIGEGAFQNNPLTTIYIGKNVSLGNNILSSDNDFKTAYQKYGAGKYIKTQEGWMKDITAYLGFNSSNGTIYSYNTAGGLNVKIPTTINGVTVRCITGGAFASSGINEVILPDTITEIGNNAFRENNLTSIQIPNGVTFIGKNAFANNQLKNIIIPDSVTNIEEGAFSSNQLEAAALSSNLLYLGESAFANNKLVEITIPNSVRIIFESAFENNYINKIDFGTSISYIPYNAFANNKLTSLIIPTNIRTIGEGAFSNNQIINLTLSEGLRNIEANAFEDNDIVSIVLPKTLENLGQGSLSNNLLSRIKIGAGVTIGDNLLTSGAWNNNFREVYNAGGAGVYAGSQVWTWSKQNVDVSYFTFDSSTGTITDYDYNGGDDVVIPEEIGGVAVTAIGNNAFKQKGLVKVLIPNTVTRIGNYAFYGNLLTTVDIPNSVTSIGISSFENNHLTNVHLGTGLTTISGCAFNHNNLVNITIPSNVTVIDSGAFANNRFEEIIIPGTVTTIWESAFVNNSLRSITIGSVITIRDDMLNYMNNNFRTAYQTGGAGNYRGTQTGTWLKNTEAKYFTYSCGADYTIIWNYDVSGGTDVVIPEYLGGNRVTKIYQKAFAGKGLTSVAIPEGVIEIYSGSFTNNSITSAIIPNSVTSIGDNAFSGNQLVNITIPNGVTSIGNSAFANNKLTTVVIPQGVTVIGDYAFSMNELTSITLPNSVTTIGNSAFYDNDLTSLVIPDSVAAIGSYAFANNLLTSVSISSNLTSISEGVFQRNLLTNVTIPNGVVSIGNNAFLLNLLTSVSIPSTVNTIGEAAFKNNKLTSVVLPNNIQIIEKECFFNNKLTTVDLPDNLIIIGEYAFANNAITEIELPNSTTAIYSYAFNNNKLSSLVIPNGVTYIYDNVFSNNLLTSVTLPNSISFIGSYAFTNNLLANIVIPSNVCYISGYSFAGNRLIYIKIGPNTWLSDFVVDSNNNNFRTAYIARRSVSNISTSETYVLTLQGTWKRTLEIESATSKWDGENLVVNLVYNGSLMQDISGVNKNQFTLNYESSGGGTISPDSISKDETEDNILILTFNNYLDISVAGANRILSYTIIDTPLKCFDKTNAETPSQTHVAIASNDQTYTPTITEPVKANHTVVTGTAMIGSTVILNINGNPQVPVVANNGTWSVIGLSLSTGDIITVTAQAPLRTISGEAMVTVLPGPSNDATLSISSKVKDSSVLNVGTPSVNTVAVLPGQVNVKMTNAEDSVGKYVTNFITSDSKATFKVVKYTSAYTNAMDVIIDYFDYDSTVNGYRNGAISEGDFFVIRVTAENGNFLYYRINANIVPDVSVTEINIYSKGLNVEKGSELVLNAEAIPENATYRDITWSSSDESVATIDQDGIARGISTGTVLITATSPEGITETVEVVVTSPRVVYSVDGTNGTLSVKINNVDIQSGDLSEEGRGVVFTATPIEGYQVKTWRINGLERDRDVNRTLTLNNIQEPTRVSVEFKKIEDYYTFDDESGTILDYDYYGGAEVVIPATIRDIPITRIGDNAFESKSITSVVLPNSLVSIGKQAFDSNDLTSVVIPEGVTSVGERAFDWNRIASLTLPQSLTSIGSYAFRNSDLTALTIPENVISIGEYAFYSNDITSLIIPNSVISIGGNAFAYNKIASLNIGSGLDNISGNVFRNNKLTSLTIPGNVKTIDAYAFADNLLASLAIGSNVESIGASSFRNNLLSEVTIPDSVISIGVGAFHGLYEEDIHLGQGVTEYLVYSNNQRTIIAGHIGTPPTQLIIPEGVTQIANNAFQLCSLTSVTIPNGVTRIGQGAFQGNLLTEIDIPDSVTYIGNFAFNVNDITSITIGSGVTIEWGLLYLSNENFKTTYLSKGAGKYVGTQAGTWNAVAYKLIAEKDGEGTINPVQGIYVYDVGDTVSISAVPAEHWELKKWIVNEAELNENSITLSMDREKKVKAVFSKITHKATFNVNGSSEISEQIIEEGNMATIPSDPIRDGYRFDGWYTDAEFTELFDFSTLVDKDITIYAKWTINSYTVTFDSKDGSSVDSQTVNYNSLVTKPSDPIKTGYSFEGWYTDEELTNIFDYNTLINNNITLYAKWTINSYTVTFDSKGGSSVDSQTVNYNLLAIKPSDPIKTGYSFEGWYTDTEITNIFDFNTLVSQNITLYAKWNPKYSDSSASVPAITPTVEKSETQNTNPTVLISQSGRGNGITATISLNTSTADSNTGVVSAKVEEDAMKSLISSMLEKGSNSNSVAQIKLNIPAESKAAKIEIPKEAFGKLEDVQNINLRIDTGVGTLELDEKTIKTISKAAGQGDISIGIAKVDAFNLPKETQERIGDRPVFDFTVKSGNTQISYFGGGSIEVNIPYTLKADENQNAIVIYYIGENGDLKTVRGKYDSASGMVSFMTKHFSQYAVGYNEVKFKDVQKNAWYKIAVDFIAAREITTGTGNGNYSPNKKLTRAQFLVMIMRAYNIEPDKNVSDNFDDAGKTYYTGYLASAKRLKISDGVGNNMYAPEKEITRQEMFTLLYNTLKAIDELPEEKTGKELRQFSDKNQIEPWAKDAMTLLVKSGIINGSGGKLSPAETANRAQVAQVLYNLLSK